MIFYFEYSLFSAFGIIAKPVQSAFRYLFVKQPVIFRGCLLSQRFPASFIHVKKFVFMSFADTVIVVSDDITDR